MKYDFTKITGVKDTPALVFYVGGNNIIYVFGDTFLKETPEDTIDVFEKHATHYKAQAVAYFNNGKLLKQWHTGDDDVWY